MISDSEFKFKGEQCRVSIRFLEGESSFATKSVFENIPNFPKIKNDLEEHKELISKLGKEEFTPISEICWSENVLSIDFEGASGKPFTRLPKLSDEATSSTLVLLSKSLEKLHEQGSWSGWLDPRLLYLGENAVSIVLALPKCLQSRSGQVESFEPFVAPEFYNTSCSLDARSDIYGVGAIGFYLLTGEAPPRHGAEDLLLHATRSDELRAVILKCLAESPEERFQILGELIEALTSADLLADSGENPSLVVLNSDEAGQSFSIKEGITTIGGSIESTIRLPKLSEQVGQFERKNGTVSFKVVSDSTVQVNKQHLKNGQVRVLNRGSIIEMSPYKFRILAPSEIYSSKAKVDFGGSESESQKFYKKAGLIMMGVALLGLGVSIFNAQQEEAAQAATDLRIRLEREKRLAAFIWTGDFYLRANSGTVSCNSVKCTKECQSAIECYSQALAIDPADSYAQSRLAQARKIIPVLAKAKQETDLVTTEESRLIQQANSQIQNGNFFCIEGECAERTVEEILKLNSLSAAGKDLLVELAAEAVDRALKARAEGNSGEIEKNYQIALRLGVSSQYLAPLKVGIEVIRRSTSSVVIIDENPKVDEKKVSSRIDSIELSQKLSASHGYIKPKNSREVLDISGLDRP